jgi:hypothetical protein
VDGILVLDEAGQTLVRDSAQRQLAQSRSAMYGAAAVKSNADRTLETTKFLRENNNIENAINSSMIDDMNAKGGNIKANGLIDAGG